ncbi:MAG TPA: hypothetical protein VGD65_16690 [Chryseosolibacter sp.]
MKAAFLVVAIILLNVMQASAQCAMCRSTLENNFSNGNPGIGAGINTGILYLLVLPYLAVLTLGYFWFKSSRNAKQELSSGHR